MNISRKMLFLVTFVAAVTTGVMLYYAEDREEVKEEREVLVRDRSVEKEPEALTDEVYKIILEDGRVAMYRVDGESKTIIDSMEIEESYYPREDILELTEGITAYTVEEGYRILENYAN